VHDIVQFTGKSNELQVIPLLLTLVHWYRASQTCPGDPTPLHNFTVSLIQLITSLVGLQAATRIGCVW